MIYFNKCLHTPDNKRANGIFVLPKALNFILFRIVFFKILRLHLHNEIKILHKFQIRYLRSLDPLHMHYIS